ncbi:hypothetical protein Elgi_42890 [Paenibacillus elgii]|uniref:hypothetical protein n=1 Tax=Paenibacillus elgii TaxID=189691 RepID=UPI002D7DB41E|nr:hypothetical protein Elgi_42890 [Paenibacillus elgii]
MKENKISYLVKIGYLLDLTDQEDEEDIEKNILRVVSDDIMITNGKTMKWESTSAIKLDPETMNCGRCCNCNNWVTDREKPNPISELNNGATVDGNLLCDECLPEDHRWSF